VSYGCTNAKPGAGTPGFARLLWWAVAAFFYRIDLADANACLPLLPLPVHGAGCGAALLWGEPR
jgi:hypothetical protein